MRRRSAYRSISKHDQLRWVSLGTNLRVQIRRSALKLLHRRGKHWWRGRSRNGHRRGRSFGRIPTINFNLNPRRSRPGLARPRIDSTEWRPAPRIRMHIEHLNVFRRQAQLAHLLRRSGRFCARRKEPLVGLARDLLLGRVHNAPVILHILLVAVVLVFIDPPTLGVPLVSAIVWRPAAFTRRRPRTRMPPAMPVRTATPASPTVTGSSWRIETRSCGGVSYGRSRAGSHPRTSGTDEGL